jgi:hypothetical protein
MHLYGGRLLRNKVKKQFEERKELRDAVVYEVVPASRYCWVQIQGSMTRIKAWYPENWVAIPEYLKPGNPVRITHPGGNKGRIEVVGHGILLPTAVAGGSGPPDPGVGADTVLSGCTQNSSGSGAMKTTVIPGTVRIGGTTYSLIGMIMDRTDLVMDRADLIMDNVGDEVSFDAASATKFRYDIIVVGTDGDAHVVKGTEAAADPEFPAVPAGHVQVGWVLIYPNMTEVTAADINKLYLAPVATELRVVIADGDLAWGELTTTITVSMRDQYGNTIAGLGAGYGITIAWTMGNGLLTYGGVSRDESASFSFYMTSSAVVTYTRDGVDPGDSSPLFEISDSITGLSRATNIILRDSSGNLMA